MDCPVTRPTVLIARRRWQGVMNHEKVRGGWWDRGDGVWNKAALGGQAGGKPGKTGAGPGIGWGQTGGRNQSRPRETGGINAAVEGETGVDGGHARRKTRVNLRKKPDRKHREKKPLDLTIISKEYCKFVLMNADKTYLKMRMWTGRSQTGGQQGEKGADLSLETRHQPNIV